MDLLLIARKVFRHQAGPDRLAQGVGAARDFALGRRRLALPRRCTMRLGRERPRRATPRVRLLTRPASKS